MSLSLTKDELCERLKDPDRFKLLILAINEDVSNVSPLYFEAEHQGKISINITEPLRELAFKWLFRAIDLTYEEGFDS